MSSGIEKVTSLRNERKPCHFWVDNEVADCYQPIVGADAIWVYCRIARYANGAWIVSPRLRGTSDTRVGLREMAEWCGKSADTVARSLEILELVGLLRSERGAARSKGRYALADVKDLVIREGGQYDRETGGFQLPTERAKELKEQVRVLRLKLARKAPLTILEADETDVENGITPRGTSVAVSDSLEAAEPVALAAASDSSVALDVQNCASGATAINLLEEINTSRKNTPPNPLVAEGEVAHEYPSGLDPEQQAHLARCRERGGDVAMWERYHRDGNAKRAELAAEDVKVRGEFPNCECAAREVMKRCGFVIGNPRNPLPGVLREVIAQGESQGVPPWVTGPRMVSAWLGRSREGPRYGPAKFYRDGHWREASAAVVNGFGPRR